MPVENTTIIRNLSQEEIDSITSEINAAPAELWAPHAPPGFYTAHFTGKTIHLHWPPGRPVHTEIPTHMQHFPYLSNFMNSNVGNWMLGRAYIHRLAPTEIVEPHFNHFTIVDFDLQNRYYIFLNVNTNNYLLFDGQLESDPSRYSYTITDQAIQKWAEFKNNSTEDWTWIVFDAVARYAPNDMPKYTPKDVLPPDVPQPYSYL